MRKNEHTVKKLEMELLRPEVRKDKKRLSELLASGFIEIASTGAILNKKDILKNLPKEEKIDWKVSGFKLKNLSNNLILITYKAKKMDLKSKKTKSSLRSSLWNNNNGNWQIIFHQGTPIK